MSFESVRFPVVDAADAVRWAEELVERGAPGRALRDLRELRVRFPCEPRLLQLMGRVFDSLGRPREAEGAYRRVLAMCPEAEEAAFDLAELLIEGGRPAEARSLIESCLARRLGSPERDSRNRGEARARSLLGDALKAEGRSAEAEREFRQALALDPGLAWAGRELSELLCEKGMLDEARRIVLDFLDRDPMDPYSHGFLGDVLRRDGKTLEAIEAFRTALWLYPGYSWAARQLAGLHCERGQPAKARAVLRAALEEEPEEPWLLACLGTTEQRLGRARQAERCFRRALALEPGMPAALDGLRGLILDNA